MKLIAYHHLAPGLKISISTPPRAFMACINKEQMGCCQPVPTFSSFSTRISPSTCVFSPRLSVLYCTLRKPPYTLRHINMCFEVLMAVIMRVNVFWGLAPCSPVDMHQDLEEPTAYNVRIKPVKICKSIFLGEAGCAPDYTA